MHCVTSTQKGIYQVWLGRSLLFSEVTVPLGPLKPSPLESPLSTWHVRFKLVSCAQFPEKKRHLSAKIKRSILEKFGEPQKLWPN